MRRGLAKVSGALALAMVAGSIATLLWDDAEVSPRTVVFSNPIAKSPGEGAPVFYIENETRKPTSCGDVSIEKDTTGLFRVIGRSDDAKRLIGLTVKDDVEKSADTDVSTKSVAKRLRIEAQATGGQDPENKALAMSALSTADLAKSGEPESLTVTWPEGFHETSREVPWRVTGDLQSGQRMYRYDRSDGASAAEDDSDVIDADELFPTVSVTWNSVDEFGKAFRGGILYAANSPPRVAFKTIVGFEVTVVLSEDGATQAMVDELAANVRTAPFRCPAVISDYTTDPTTQTRVAGDDWVAYLDNTRSSETQCAIPEATIYDGALLSSPAEDLECSPQQTFSVAKKPRLKETSEMIAFVAQPPVATIRISEPSGRALSSYALVPDPGSEYGVTAGDFTAPAGVDVLLVEALDGQGATVETASYRLRCRYTETCSPLHQLLALPAIPIDDRANGTQTSSLHLGTAELPKSMWPPDNSNVGPAELATTTKHWCALLDMTSQSLADAGSIGRDGMAACSPTDTLRPDTLTVDTETLDYVGAMSMTVVVVGSDISKVRVSAKGSTETFDVQRTQPGPGAVSFDDPSLYGENQVTYEGLDAAGHLIATTHST